jgi:hypothetical protein
MTSLRILVVWIGIFFVIGGSAGIANADDERAEVLKKFEELSNRVNERLDKDGIKWRNVKSAAPDANGQAEVTSLDELKKSLARVKPVEVVVGGKPVSTRLFVKVWAELATSGKKVSLSGYDWRQKEQFYLCFQPSVPVRFAFHQTDKDVKPSMILPVPRYTESFEIIRPGKVFRLPIRLEMLDTDDDEAVTFTFLQAGSGPDPTTGGAADDEIGVLASKDYCTEMDNVFTKTIASAAKRMRVIDLPRTGRRVSEDFNEIALIAVGVNDVGFIPFTMRKER